MIIVIMILMIIHYEKIAFLGPIIVVFNILLIYVTRVILNDNEIKSKLN